MRSLTLPVGLSLSSLAKSRTALVGLSRGNSTSRVLPIAAIRSGARIAQARPPAIAGRMITVSLCTTGVANPCMVRTSSSFR